MIFDYFEFHSIARCLRFFFVYFFLTLHQIMVTKQERRILCFRVALVAYVGKFETKEAIEINLFYSQPRLVLF